MDNQKEIDDIINMLDNFVISGGGHMNIEVADPSNLDNITVDTYNSTDCSTGNSACRVPTLHEGIDE